MSLLFKNYINKKTNNKITNIKNILNLNNNLSSNLISYKNLLELNLKGLLKYNKNLISYISLLNNKNLIITIKKNPLSRLNYKSDINLFSIKTNKSSEENKIKLEKLIEKEEEQISLINNKTQKINKYLNSITVTNSIIKNKKDKIFTYAQEINYKFQYTNNKLIKKIYTFLFYSFLSMNTLISKPKFEITNEKVIIHLFFYLFKENNNNNKNNTFIKINHIKLNILCKILSRFFNKPVELELVRLYYPYFDSNIFVNLLQILFNKIQVRIIMQTFFKKAIIKNPINMNRTNFDLKLPSFLTGINLRIGGRLTPNKIIPKQTIKIIRKGTIAKGKLNFLDKARFTNKNKRGAFTITISIGHYLTS